MSVIAKRRKNPEELRRLLIEAAVTLATRQGLAAVSVESVAGAAGVTKGGLFHHFPTKQALTQAVFSHLMDEYDAEIDALMRADPEPHGRFTRAYLALSFLDDSHADMVSLWLSAIADPVLSRLYTTWLIARLDRLPLTETGPDLEAVRFAADGIWMGAATGVLSGDPAALHDRLRAMTFPARIQATT